MHRQPRTSPPDISNHRQPSLCGLLCYTLHSTLYTVHTTRYTRHSSLYTPYLTLYTLHSSPTARHQHPSATFTLRDPAGSFASQQLPKRASLQIARPSHALSSLQSNHVHRQPRTSPQTSAAIGNLHYVGSFASQQPPNRASPQRARPSHALVPPTFSPSYTLPRPLYFILPFPLFFHWSFLVFPLFCYALTPLLHRFTLYSTCPKCTSEDRPGGNRTPPSPNCHLVHQPQNRSKIDHGGHRWGSASKWSVLQPPPPDPLFSLRSQWATSPCLTAGFRNIIVHRSTSQCIVVHRSTS